MSNVSTTDRIQELENLLKDGNLVNVRCTDRLSALRKEYLAKKEELANLGIKDINKAKEEIENRGKALNQKIDDALKLIPQDIINKYKNFDFTSGEVEEVNLERPF